MAIVVKGWPRLSETFVAQELKALEDRGLRFDIWSLRRPTDRLRHAIHAKVRAKVRYLPEYTHEAPLTIFDAVFKAAALPGFGRALNLWMRDLGRDFSRNRIRRFGQACVLATQAPPNLRFIYAHFMHTPGSVARYAAAMRDVEWGFSAHARDIWTTPDWELREKIAESRFGVTCTNVGARRLKALTTNPDKISLVYHGLDLSRFPPPPEREGRDGAMAMAPVRLISVGRLVEKKGYDVLLDALAELPPALHWQFAHIGDGPLAGALKKRARELGLSDRISWRGPKTQDEVIGALRWADIFVLPSRPATDGDRDGLPNVLMEAASQGTAVVSTRFSAIPEFVTDEVTGILVKPGDAGALSAAIAIVARRPDKRSQMARAAHARLVAEFGAGAAGDAVAKRLMVALAPARGAAGASAAD
ncbi:glycosyltransferase [Rubrimonas cliftonensis]|uniref:glycosyltransferase n=1 Tax=Rubrimonas cliftonensis TaxID=89524 RepID=UPI003CCBF49E